MVAGAAAAYGAAPADMPLLLSSVACKSTDANLGACDMLGFAASASGSGGAAASASVAVAAVACRCGAGLRCCLLSA